VDKNQAKVLFVLDLFGMFFLIIVLFCFEGSFYSCLVCVLFWPYVCLLFGFVGFGQLDSETIYDVSCLVQRITKHATPSWAYSFFSSGFGGQETIHG